MDENLDKTQPASVTKRAAAERVALIFGIVVFPVLAIALGIGITILSNALR